VTGLDQRQRTTTTGCDYNNNNNNNCYYYYYYWLGLDKLYRLMQLGSFKLRVEVSELIQHCHHHMIAIV